MALNGIPINPQQPMGDSLSTLNNSFIELDSRTVNLSQTVFELSGSYVKQIVAGSNITIDPPSGTGIVTINSLGGGGGGGLTEAVKYQFTGNGSNSTYTLVGLTSASTNPANYRVDLNGVLQEPGADFTIISATPRQLSFTSPPPNGVKIVIVTGEPVESGMLEAWTSTYTTVRSFSSTWGSGGSNVGGLSGNWENTYTTVQSKSANWDSVYSTVQTNSATNWNYQGTDLKGLSANWQNTFNTVQTNSATNWNNSVANQYAHTNFLPLSGGTIMQNLEVQGNLTVQGTTTQINTEVATTSAVSIDTDSTVTALRITQRGSGDVLRVEDENPETSPFIINNTGRVGIGEITPEAKLHVKTGSAGTVTADVSSVGVFESDGHAYISLLSPSSRFSGIVMGSPGDNYAAYVNWNHDNGDLKVATSHPGADIQFLVDSEVETMRITPTSRVGIGTATPNERLTVSGNISASGNIAAQSSTVPVTVTNVTSNRTFSDSDTNKVFHLSGSTPLSAIFPSSLSDGFNVALMNTGTSTVFLSTNSPYRAIGNSLQTQFAGAYVYKASSQIFAVGGF